MNFKSALSALLAATLVAVFASPTLAAGRPKTDAGVTIVKPGAKIPKSAMRKFEGKSYHGALAVSRGGKAAHYITRGANSAKVAADTARMACEVKAGGPCEVVALKVPSSAGRSFDSALKSSGLSQTCTQLLATLREPKYRKSAIFGPCNIRFDSGDAKRNLNDAKQPGLTLFVARTDLYGASFIYGPDPARAKKAALDLCRQWQSAFAQSVANHKEYDPEDRISNRRDMKIETAVITSYMQANPKLTQCRIVGQEVLP